MTRTRWCARALCVAAFAAAAGTWYARSAGGTTGLAVAAIGLLLVGEHLARRARREQAIASRLAALGHALPARPVPCCSFWRHSDGAVHGPDCSRPPAERFVHRDVRLTDAERAAFAEITRRYDHGTAA